MWSRAEMFLSRCWPLARGSGVVGHGIDGEMLCWRQSRAVSAVSNPVNARCWSSPGSVSGQRLWRWPDTELKLENHTFWILPARIPSCQEVPVLSLHCQNPARATCKSLLNAARAGLMPSATNNCVSHSIRKRQLQMNGISQPQLRYNRHGSKLQN